MRGAMKNLGARSWRCVNKQNRTESTETKEQGKREMLRLKEGNANKDTHYWKCESSVVPLNVNSEEGVCVPFFWNFVVKAGV
jgi:hypothetical protein